MTSGAAEQPTLVVLAAGLGSRYGGSKQLETVGPRGETLVDYSVFDAMRAGFGKTVFVVRRAMADSFEKLATRYPAEIHVACAFQEVDRLPAGLTAPRVRDKPWGTGHAVWCAADEADTPFAVINADDFYGRAAFLAAASHLQATTDAVVPEYCMVGYTLRETLSSQGAVSRAVCRCRPDGHLEGIIETHGLVPGAHGGRDPGPQEPETARLTGDETVSMNFWGFTPAIFADLEQLLFRFVEREGHQPDSEFYLPRAINALVDRGAARVRVLPVGTGWFGLTHPADRDVSRQRIRELVAAGVYPSPLWPHAAGKPA